MFLKNCVALALICFTLRAETILRFEPASPDIGPFPTNYLTRADPGQLTGRRINLPVPAGCLTGSPASECLDVMLLNELDGFNVYPQLRVCFSGPVNPATLDDGLFLISLSEFALPIRVTRVIYDGSTNCALAKPDGVLGSGKTYALVATNAIRDTQGKAVRPDLRFTNALVGAIGEYFGSAANLQLILNRLTGHVVGASVFTTLSATDWIQNARAFVNSDAIAGALAPAITVAKLSDLQSMTWLAQTSIAAATPFPIPLNRLDGVDRVAIGTYLSPNFLSNTTLTIPQVPTKTGTLTKQPIPIPLPDLPPGYAPVSFHVFLPEGPKPSKGYPVAIYGHGLGDNQWVGATTYIASTLAKKGIALIGFEVFGHGFGPGSAVQLAPKSGAAFALPSPGRTIPSPNGEFNLERSGCIILPGPFASRDCLRQSAADVFTLVKLLSKPNSLSSQLGLDINRISYIGQSFGSLLGSTVMSTEPRIKAAVLNTGGGPAVDVARQQNPPALAIAYLLTRTPPVFAPDVIAFRGQAPVLADITVPKLFEVAEWFNMPGDPLPFASGLTNKPVLFQIAKGDQEVPNPTNSTLIRAARSQDTTWLYRADTAAQIVGKSNLPAQPHRFLSEPDMFLTPARTSIAKAAQEQVAEFLASDGRKIVDPDEFLAPPFRESDKLFEVPRVLPDLP